NVQFLKVNFIEKSELNIGKYKIDLNSRELISKKNVLKLTEKETNILIYLSKSNDAVGVDQLQSEVWQYHSNLETHTVETHVYRLRKKIFKTFNDENFIISKKNGYQIN
ncbi:winged helix-turn-helix domain-containing protein, partial [Candidatus Pelagibacter sp.]|nr:winged helix-turn-helix domain-containing protein [Candidatus Pelagibacter sp.]